MTIHLLACKWVSLLLALRAYTPNLGHSMRKTVRAPHRLRSMERIVEEGLVERTGGFRISAIAAAALLLLGGGEAFAGATSDLNADTVGCFNRALGGSPGSIWSMSASNDPAGPALWTEYGGRGSTIVPLVAKWGGGAVSGVGAADATEDPTVFWTAETIASGAPSTTSAAYELAVVGAYGGTNDPVPLAGNFGGAGLPGVGHYYHDSGVWVLDTNPGNGTLIPAFAFGPTGDPADIIPVVGDFNGDGNDTVGIYDRPNGTFFLTTTVLQTPTSINPNAFEEINNTALIFTFGPTGDNWIPVIGDWDLQNGDSIGLYDPETGTFYLKNSNSDGSGQGPGGSDITEGADIITTYSDGGTPADCVPIAGNWNIGG